MTQIQFKLANDQQEVADAIAQFVADEFGQTVHFAPDKTGVNSPHKAAGIGELLWLVATAVATVEGSLQFAERVARAKRVKALLALIKAKGQSVLIKIGNKPAEDLLNKSVDETMDLLADKKADEDSEKQ